MQENVSLDWRAYLQEWHKSNSITTPIHLMKIRNEFNQRFPKENLSQLKIEEYGLDNYSFCQFLELSLSDKIVEINKIKIDYNKHKYYGVYWSNQSDNWKKADNFFKVETAEEAFEKIKIGLVNLLQAVENKEFDKLDKIAADQYLGTNSHLLAYRTLYLYYPTKFIPRLSIETLNFFLDFFNLSCSDGFFIKNLKLYNYLKSLPEFKDKFSSWGITKFLLDFKKLSNLKNKLNLDTFSKANTLNQITNTSKTNNAWIFQGNPNLFDLRSALSELEQFTWLVNQHKDKIRSGDRVFFWESGNESGILGTGIIISEPKMQEENPKERIFNIDDSKFEGEQFRVLIEVEIFFKNPILRKQLIKYPELSNLSILRHSQGTNFPVTTEEAEFLESLIGQYLETLIETPMPIYTWEDLESETFYASDFLERLIRTLERKQQIILTDCPGSGKTYLADKLAQYLTSDTNGLIDIIQFHPAYNYEDFMQGLRPIADDQNNLTYKVVSGRFLEFCERARNCQGNCVLIIDEINRANLAAVFGELMYLLEYRDRYIKLAGSSELFSIPKNVYLIGTMNTADRSIALVDHALHRRFAFIELRPDYNILRLWHRQKQTNFEIEGLIQVLKTVNSSIGDPHYHIGISFFLDENLRENIADIWELEILPYLEEIFYDSSDKLQTFNWKSIEHEILGYSK